MNQCFRQKTAVLNLLLIATRKTSTRLLIPGHSACKSRLYSSTSSRHFQTMDGISFVGTSARGITKEVEIPVPWGIIAGKTYGDPTKFPVLCTHGWLDNCNTFDALIPHLPQDNFFVMIDFPGHGSSSPLHKGMTYTMYLYISVLQRVVKYYNWEKFSILGHSLGGNVGALFSGTYPETVDKLILIDVLGLYPVPAEKGPKQLRESIRGYLELEENPSKFDACYDYETAKQRLLKANKSLTENSADILLERGTKKLENGSFSFTRDPRHRLKYPVSMSPEVGLTFIRKVEADTLHIIAQSGMLRHKVSGAGTKLIEDIINSFSNVQSKELVEVEGKHHVHLCNPEAVADNIINFLSKPHRSNLGQKKTDSSNM
uniref:Serine hydrolase-like protein n=1 Tax=Phallusia mammillata TaxID=59560 RepID=A0A6F9DSK3_9ASCI|nr:serine hydrolase-like protein [Phallusia mammillata]